MFALRLLATFCAAWTIGCRPTACVRLSPSIGGASPCAYRRIAQLIVTTTTDTGLKVRAEGSKFRW